MDSDPSSIAFAQLAEEYRRAGQFEAAEQCCRTGLARHPAYLSARVTLGRTLIELNKLDEAEHELQQVLKAAPDNLAAIRGIAEIHQRLGRLDESLEYHRRALTLARHDPELEEIVAKLNRELSPPPASASLPDGPTDFDMLLGSLGINGNAAPPAVEALLEDKPRPSGATESSPIEGSQSAIANLQSLVDSLSTIAGGPPVDESAGTETPAPAAPEPDWMVGPLPTISAPPDTPEGAAADTVSLAPGIEAVLAAAFENRAQFDPEPAVDGEPPPAPAVAAEATDRATSAVAGIEASAGQTVTGAGGNRAEPVSEMAVSALAFGDVEASFGAASPAADAASAAPDPAENRTAFDSAVALDGALTSDLPSPLEAAPALSTPDAPHAPAALIALEAPAAPHALIALEAPAAPHALIAPEAPAAPHALIAPEAPAAPHAPIAPSAPDEPIAPETLSDRDRRILEELEAWLAAIKR